MQPTTVTVTALSEGKVYEGKTPALVTSPTGEHYYDDRQVVKLTKTGAGVLDYSVQYETGAGYAPNYPTVSAADFLQWAGRDVTALMPPTGTEGKYFFRTWAEPNTASVTVEKPAEQSAGIGQLTINSQPTETPSDKQPAANLGTRLGYGGQNKDGQKTGPPSAPSELVNYLADLSGQSAPAANPATAPLTGGAVPTTVRQRAPGYKAATKPVTATQSVAGGNSQVTSSATLGKPEGAEGTNPAEVVTSPPVGANAEGLAAAGSALAEASHENQPSADAGTIAGTSLAEQPNQPTGESSDTSDTAESLKDKALNH